MGTHLDVEVRRSVLRLRRTLLLLLLLRGRRTLRRWRSLRPEELRRCVRVRMLQMMGRRGLMVLQMVRRRRCERGHKMFLAANDVDPGFQQHDAATAGAHCQSGGGVLLKFLLARGRLAASWCATAIEIYKNQLG